MPADLPPVPPPDGLPDDPDGALHVLEELARTAELHTNLGAFSDPASSAAASFAAPAQNIKQSAGDKCVD